MKRTARNAAADVRPESPPLWPGLVSDLCRYKKFVFPGEPFQSPPPIALTDFVEKIRDRANTIEADRSFLEGHPEFWAKILADEILTWLAGRAEGGSEPAQLALADVATKAAFLYGVGLHRKHPSALMHARRNPEIPGFVSLNPQACASTQKFLEDLGQGSETPVPMGRTVGKKSPRDVRKAKHKLVACLYQYMESYRNEIKALGVPAEHPEIPPRVREILSLPHLSRTGDTWKKWHAVGWKIVRDVTGKEGPSAHEAFNRPPLDELNDTNGQGGSTISTRLAEAWKELASSKCSLEGEP